jgi:DNA-binding MarR family transcriptional regulator
MSKRDALPYDVTQTVRLCLCFHAQRAARALARRFDEAFRPIGLTNWQFSLMMVLHRPAPARMGEVAAALAMDRTTLTAALKPLVRRGWVRVEVDPGDKRGRRLALTASGRRVLVAALPIWKREHAKLDRLLPESRPDRLRADLRTLS